MRGEMRRGWVALVAGFDGVAEPLVEAAFLEVAGSGDGEHLFDAATARFTLSPNESLR